MTLPVGRWTLVASWLLSFVVLVVACGGGGVTPDPTGQPSPAPTTGPAVGPVTTPEEAVAAVIAREPRLTGIMERDLDMIGQSAYWEAMPASGVGAFLVRIYVGWGDCQAGCIDAHTWLYAVAPDGTVALQQETGGGPVPDDAWPSPGGDGTTGLRILATAGPVCPVESVPPDPACAPKVVPGALVVIRDAAGGEIARATLDDDGSAVVEVPAGGYVVEAQPVEGMMGTPAPVSVTVVDGAAALVELSYDTGIR